MKIKASSISNLTDARYFAAWNVEWLGFCLEPGNPDYASPQDIQEIKDWLVGPKIVGEFGISQSIEEISSSIDLLKLDAVQLGMFAEDTTAKAVTSVPVIKEWILEDLEGMVTFEQACERLKDDADYFLLDLEKSGISWPDLSANQNQLHRLQKLCEEYAIILAIACPPAQLEIMIDTIKPHGLSVRGGDEEKVGVKSFDDLDEIYDVLEELDLIGF